MARHNLAQAVLVLLMMRVSLHGASEADEVERCTSNRLHKFDPIVPKKRRYSDLSLCHKFAQKTCCNRTHTDGLARKVRLMQLANFRPACVDLSETVHCMGCHPEVGVGNSVAVCIRLCNEWYQACKRDYYAAQGIKNVPTPCLQDSLICSPLGAFVESGEELCKLYGFNVAPAGEDGCYDGKVDPLAVGEDDHVSALSHLKKMILDRPEKLWIGIGASLLVGVVTLALFCCGRDA